MHLDEYLAQELNISKKKAYEIFQEVFPLYLSLGMSYDEFYNKDCQLVKAYLKAYELKQQRDNTNMWIQGMYVYDAILCASPILHPFAKGGTEPVPYMKEPYALSKEEQEVREEKAKREQMLKGKAYMEHKLGIINKKFKGGGDVANRG